MSSAPSEIIIPGSETEVGAKIALVYTEEQKDSDFGQSAYSTIKLFSGEEGVSFSAYLIEGADFETGYSTVELAIKGGAKVVVMIGDEMASYMKKAQNQYEDVDFIIINSDKEPAHGAYVEFNMGHAGYMAGYSGVYEGGRKIYLLGEENAGAKAQSYHNGVVLGADAACAKLSLEKGAVIVRSLPFVTTEEEIEALRNYIYNDISDEKAFIYAFTQEEQELAESLVSDSKIKFYAIEPYSFGEYDVSAVTLIKKVPKKVLYDLLLEWKEHGFFHSSRQVYAGASDEALAFDMDNANFRVFTKSSYESLMSSFGSGVLSSRVELFTRAKNGTVPVKAEAIPASYLLVNPEELSADEEENSEETGEEGEIRVDSGDAEQQASQPVPDESSDE